MAHQQTGLFDFVTVTNGTLSFSPVSNYCSGGEDANGVAVGDFNGDGKLDLAVTNTQLMGNDTADRIGILLGNGHGSFSPATTVTSGGNTAWGVVAGDFNHDGKLDLAVTNEQSGTVGILLGNGNGGFSGPTIYSSGGSNPCVIVTADFNGDGNLDLAVSDAGSSTVGILLGNGSGGFSGPTTFSAGTGAWGLAAGDFNNDGKPDLAVANSGHGTVAILLGNGNGAFSAPTTFSSGGSYPTNLTTADFNGDGNLDLAVTNCRTGDTVGILLGDGHGGFGTAANFPTGGTASYDSWDLVAADFNGDGKLDLAVTASQDSVVELLLGNGNGGFSAPTAFSGVIYPQGLATGDFNGDGRPDLAVPIVGSNYVGVF